MRKKVALFHHNILANRGGGDLVSCWVMEALKDDYDLTYITWGNSIDLAEVDTFYGTHLQSSGMKIEYIPSLTLLKLKDRPYRFIIALIERYLKKRKDEFDVMFSTYNELDFGKRGIQFIHGPDFGSAANVPDERPTATNSAVMPNEKTNRYTNPITALCVQKE